MRALCHNRVLDAAPRLEVVRGSIAERDVVDEAMDGVTHVLHLATSKETPETIMDVAMKGLFWLLEAARESATFQQFVLVGGDASVGHFFYPHHVPLTEEHPHRAYPGCYALSKVLEEVMVEQACIQYDLNVCCLRAPWIMEKDDFRYQLSFGEDVFGGPRWRDLVGAERADAYVADRHRAGDARPGRPPGEAELRPRRGPRRRDRGGARQPRGAAQTFNVCMDEPVDYGELAAYLAETRGLPSVRIPTPYHSMWLDNAKAKFVLGWRPRHDLARLVEESWTYERAPDDPRVVWYPG